MKCLSAVMVLALTILLGGCARFPTGVGTTTLREMSFTIDFDAPINDDYYYFVAIDTSGGGDGPVPVFPGVGVPGQGWVTGSADFFVQYHARQYTVNKVSLNPAFVTSPFGAPIRSTIPDAGSKTLRFTIDLNAIGATGPSVDINIIAVSDKEASDRLLDGLGVGGTQFLSEVNIQSDRTITNLEDSLQPETSHDVLDQNQTIVPGQPTPQTAPLDIVNWTITTDV